MARISDIELSRLKDEISIQRLVEARGIELRKHGSSDFIGRCPFHDDKTPSLVVSPKKNLWNCLGACGTGGTVIDWTMKCEGVSFRHAVDLLRSDAGLSDELRKGRNGSKVVSYSTKPKLAAPVSSDVDDAVLLSQIVDYYHQALKESPEALAYLEARGLGHPKLIDTFKLGFCNRTLGYRLPKKNREAGAKMRASLLRIGILRTSGHEHFNGSIVVPIFGEDGAVVEMYGRKISPKLRKGTPNHLYLPGPHAGVFNWQGVSDAKEGHVILCESLIDAMTFWCAGIRNVTTSYGTSGFTDEHLEAFVRHGIRRVTIAYDRDTAGEAAMAKLAKRLGEHGITVYGAQFPKGMDANEYAMKMQPAEKALKMVIRNAKWIVGVCPSSTTASPVSSSAAEPEIREAPRLTGKNENCVNGESLPSLAALEVREEESPPHPADAAEDRETPIAMQESDRELRFGFGDRTVRIRGLAKNRSYDQLKVNILFARGDVFFVDSVDLYSARHRAAFLKQAADELELGIDILKKDLGRVLLKLEEMQEKAIEATLTTKEERVILSESERDEALELLRDPSLLSRILADFEACGVVGEETNKLAGYLGTISRKLDKPLAMIVQSTSAAGKSALMEAVLAFVPKEERIKYSAMTGQSLYYLGEQSLQHKVLAVVEEEGAERASYALKLLQSEGELTIASTGKDPQTGKLVTSEYHVEGPVMLFLTTTAIEIDEELLNRCLVLSVDEGSEQTAAIHKTQRHSRTLEGLLGRTRKNTILSLHQNAQRLLRSLAVVNPFAEELTFSTSKTRMRRDHMKYLTLIDTIALLRQHQREIKTVAHKGETIEYIEVSRKDIEVADRLAAELLGRSLDELPPQTRRLLDIIDAFAEARSKELSIDLGDIRFSRRQLREHCSWSDTQLRVHLGRLTEMEFLLVHLGGGQGRRFVYGRSYDANFAGLSSTSRGDNTNFAGTSRPLRGEFAGGSRGVNSSELDAQSPNLDKSSIWGAASTTREIKNGVSVVS